MNEIDHYSFGTTPVPTPSDQPEPPIQEPEPDHLPDETPLPNPDENPQPPVHA